MMPYQSYQLWQAERSQTAREWQAADRRRGELAAAFGGLLHPGMLHPAARPSRVARRRRAAARLAEGLQR
jgi:hypothetical protein